MVLLMVIDCSKGPLMSLGSCLVQVITTNDYLRLLLNSCGVGGWRRWRPEEMYRGDMEGKRGELVVEGRERQIATAEISIVYYYRYLSIFDLEIPINSIISRIFV